MADLRDFTGKNRKFTGTIGERISTGTTAERDENTFGAGTLRFNTSTNLMEYYTGTEWKSIDAPPVITGFTINGGSTLTSGEVDNEASGNVTIEIIGSLFDTTGGNVTFIGTGETLTPVIQTRNSGNLFTVQLPHSSFDDANSPYTIRMTNGSGLSAELVAAISSDHTAPVFITTAGTLGTITNSNRSSYTLSSAAAIDADGDTITYSVSAGSLPAGLSLASSTAAITGTATSVVTNTTSTFTVSAATTQFTSTRQFSITVNAPIVESFTGPGTFSVPSGTTSVDVLVVGGGGGGGGFGAGGAGGLIFRPGFTVTPGGTVSVTVGNGGSGTPGSGPSQNGQNSVFSTLTAVGGGGGGQNSSGGDNPPNMNVGDGGPGGSGGGGGHPNSTSQGPPGGTGGPGTQPTQPGDSGTYGFGNPGGQGRNNVPSNDGQPVSTAGGGGGSGAAGTPGNAQNTNEHGGQGGIGKAYDISGTSIFYAGGGGGAYGGNGGQGGGGPAENTTGQNAGTANRGGGGGTRFSGGPGTGGPGGSGIVIVRY